MEDDPEQAVRAGLAILRNARLLAERFREERHLPNFGVRVGIHTGTVLLGGGVNAEGSIRGVAVNIAARMEQSAPVGSLRISQATYRHVRGMFDVEPQAPIEIKGITGAVRSYLVLQARARTYETANRGLEGIEVPTLGREAELARIEATLEAARAAKAAFVVTVVGEPGIGKSRLSLEFARRLGRLVDGAEIFQARPQPYGSEVPYGLLRYLLAWRMGIQESDSQEIAQEKLSAGLGPFLGDRSAEGTALIGQLIGLDYRADPHIRDIIEAAKQIRDRAFHFLSVYLRESHRTSGVPLALLLDDLHWADHGSLDLIEHVAKACSDLPLLILCLTRPSLFERRPSWGSDHSHVRIDLAPLADSTATELVEALLNRLKPVPPALRDLLISTAEGNPFFVEELVAMLIDDEVVVTCTEPWHVDTSKLGKVRVPTTLAGVLQARIDALTASEKLVLQRASVVGHIFWDEPLQSVAPSLTGNLDALVRRDLTFHKETSAFEGTREFVFKHHVLHHVAYQGVLKDARREQHRLTADWLVVRSGDRAGEYLGLIAEHYESAGDDIKAVAYLQKAGEDAASRYANQIALAYLGRALALRPSSAIRFELLMIRARVYKHMGHRTDEEADVTALEQLAEQLDDDEARSNAAGRRSSLALETDSFDAATAAAGRAVAWAEAARTRGAALQAQICWALALRYQADYANAQAHAESALALAREVGNRQVEGNVLLQLGILAHQQDHYGHARNHYRNACDVARATGDRSTEAGALNALGDIEWMSGSLDVASQLFEASRRICAEIGYRKGESTVLSNLAGILLDRGAAAESIECIEQANAIATAIADRNMQACLLNLRGNALTALGHWNAAADCYAKSVEMYRAIGRPNMPPEPMAGLARLAWARSDPSAAMSAINEVLAHFDAGGSISGTGDPLRIYLTCYDVLSAAGAPRAGELLERAYQQLIARAALLDEGGRRTFLENVPTHRAILAAWEGMAFRHESRNAGSMTSNDGLGGG